MSSLSQNALTSVSDVKENLGLASSDTSKDNLITRKINQASTMIETYCQRSFKSASYTQEYSGTGTDQIVLKQRPITGTPTVESRDTTLNESDWSSVDAELLFSDLNAGILNLNFTANGRWNRYRVTYTAGYSTIPDDLAEACASLAAYLVTNAAATQVNVASMKEGQRSVQYSSGLKSASDLFNQLGIDGILDSYANYPISEYA